MAPYGAAVAVDIGGTKISAGLVRADGEVRHLSRRPTPAQEGARAVLSATAALVARVRATAAAEGERADVLGVATAGVVDEGGCVVGATDHIRGWVGAQVTRELSRAAGLPTTTVNDVHAHAVGESLAGAGRGRASVLVVAVGTGVGGALVVDGSLHRGAHGAAGHLGHLPSPEAAGIRCPCGAIGHLEAVASGGGLAALYRRLGGEAAGADEVLALAGHGDPVARECVATAGTALGRAIGGWVNTMDPDVVVVTGGLAQAGGIWWAAVREAAERECVPLLRGCPIVPSALSSRAPLVGAAAAARQVPSVAEVPA